MQASVELVGQSLSNRGMFHHFFDVTKSSQSGQKVCNDRTRSEQDSKYEGEAYSATPSGNDRVI